MSPLNLILLIFLIQYSSASLTGTLAKAWENFWTVTCSFSTVHARTERSIQSLPDRHDPSALLQYLFPLANLKVQDIHHPEFRSFDNPLLDLSTWLADLVDLWHSECHQRSRTKRRRVKTRKVNRRQMRQYANWTEPLMEDPGEDVLWKNYMGNWPYYSYDSTTAEPVEDDPYESMEEEDDEEEYEETSTTENPENSGETSTEGPKKKKKKKEEETTTTTTETTTTTTTETTTTTAAPGDPYFTSYGGDIEYNIPIMTFTIPFDGEIVILGGFHGFTGLLPYK